MNAINWFEIPASDFERATRFYGQIFATTLHVDSSFDGIRMAVFPHEGASVGGAVIEMSQARPHSDGVRVYLNGGENLSAVLDRVEAAGGKVTLPKTFLREEIGHIAMFADTEGNLIGLHSLR
ncbi:VOC family protein [Viridibacterium curvum]|uniref:VOC family protein n=1 Tax=Viridibacterium curvum TaxID=1101404 RepID=A0ABP9QNU9_9RHOO